MILKLVISYLLVTVSNGDLVRELSCEFQDFCDYAFYGEDDTRGWSIRGPRGPRQSQILDGPLSGAQGIC